MKTLIIITFLLLFQYSYSQDGIIIDHRHTDISQIPDEYIAAAKSNLKIRYFRRSHGSQIDLGGMAALLRFSTDYANKFSFNKTGVDGALFLSTQIPSEPWNSLDFENATWVQITRSYLDNPANAQINVVMWAWSSSFYLCSAQQYLNDMEMLIAEYGPGGSKNRAVPVLFVFQTACGQRSLSRNHIIFDGNKLIRNHCINQNRILFDFNDLETYNPDGEYFGDADTFGNYTDIRLLNDDLAYISSNPGGSIYPECRNWGIDWMQSNPNVELTLLAGDDKCTTCPHSEGTIEGDFKDNSRLHCVLKGRAAWYLWATLAGWNNQGGNQNPIAKANGTYTALVNQAITFSSAGSTDPDGNIVSYLWSFGDGVTSSQANPVHTFNAVGTYAVSLTVTDNEGASGISNTSANITLTAVNLPPIVNLNGPYQALIGVGINFSSMGSSDPDGNIASYQWSFGGRETSNLANPTFSYSTAGNYTVSLTLIDNDGASNTSTTTATITASSGNSSPIADANGPYVALVGEEITFSSAGSSDPDGHIVSYLWLFGDGITSTQANPVHTFNAVGTYAVSLTVTDNEGASGISNTSANITLTAVNLPPIVNLNGPYQALIGVGINFSSAGSSDPDGNIASYHWSFGGRETSNLANPTFSYSTAGNYTVSLTLIDNDGASNTSTTTATITASSGNSSPIADANGPYVALVGEEITFSSAGSSDPDGHIVSYLWSFGGRARSNLANPVYTYWLPGNYTVTLTVTDNDGTTDTQSTIANIALNNVTQNTILVQSYFETDWDSWKEASATVERYNGPFSYEGTYSLKFSDKLGVGSSVKSFVSDVRAFDQISIDFYFCTSNMKDGEELSINYYNGSRWQSIKSYSAASDFINEIFYHGNTVMNKTDYNFPENARFEFQCKAGETDHVIYLDAVSIKGIINNGSIKSKTEIIEAISKVNSSELKTPDFHMYPNPASDIINIVGRVDASTIAEIYTVNGHLIRTLQLLNNKTAIDINSFMSGIYIIKIRSDDAFFSKMFFKN